MKFIGKLLAAIAIFLWTGGISQVNLVPNPSFEEYYHLPDGTGDGRTSIKYWEVPVTRGETDYYHSNSPNKDSRTENNYFGGEKPHSGNAYAGFCVTDEYREFVAVNLLQRLVKGKQYKISFYISKGDKVWLGNLSEIGVLFLKKSMIIPFGVSMNCPPQVVFYDEKGFTQHEGWQELSAIYTAEGTEQWMCIGPHEWKCDTCVRKQNPGISGALKEAHYFIDDVSVTLITDDTKPVFTEPNLSIDTTAFKPQTTYAFYNIRFKSNSAVLDTGAQVELDQILKYMAEHTEMNVTVTGHTDSIGSRDNNFNLSRARADAVKKYLMDHGIQSARITTVGGGEEKPVAPNSTEAGRALNRRVEFLFTQH